MKKIWQVTKKLFYLWLLVSIITGIVTSIKKDSEPNRSQIQQKRRTENSPRKGQIIDVASENNTTSSVWTVTSRSQQRFTAEETSQILTTYELLVPKNTSANKMESIFEELVKQMTKEKRLGDLLAGVIVKFVRYGDESPVAFYEETDVQKKLIFGSFAVMNHKMTCPPQRSDQMYPNGDIYFQSTQAESVKAASIMNVKGDFNMVSAEIVLFPGFRRGEQLARMCMDEALERLQQTHRSSYYQFKFFYSDCWWQVAQGDYRRRDGYKQVLMIQE